MKSVLSIVVSLSVLSANEAFLPEIMTSFRGAQRRPLARTPAATNSVPSSSSTTVVVRASAAASSDDNASTTTTTTTTTSKNPPATDNPLIQRAHDILYNKSGFYSSADPNVFSDDFVFRGPYIGPLNKVDYLETLDTFGIYRAIPDINPNAFGFTIDPLNENRVWFLVRNTGTFTGEPGLQLGNGITVPPNGSKIEGCPETFSIIFDEKDPEKMKYLSVGYVADRFEGNTNGKGAAVGIFNAVGMPFPAPGPLLSFAQWFGTEVINGGASSYSTENIPSWWTSQEKASEGYL